MSANTEAQGSGRGPGSDEVGRCGGIAPRWRLSATIFIATLCCRCVRCTVVILIAAAGGVALLTTKGKATVAFAREARTEVRKVIWYDSPGKHCTPR